MRIAINICDLASIRGSEAGGAFALQILLADFMDAKSPIVKAEKGCVDGGAVVLDGPASVDEERTRALVEVLQTIIGPRKIKRRVRCYRQGARGGWQPLRT